MSQITVGYTDKVRKAQPRGPAGGISDIFGFSDDSNRNNHNGKQQDKVVTTNQSNNTTESKICERTESLSIEENSNVVTETVHATKIEVEETKTISSEVSNNEGVNGNTKENGNTENTVKATPKKAVNNIIHTDEKDSAAPQKRNRVPPGGFSSGLW